MSAEGLSLRYYLFSISNLVAALGGGLILGKGAGVIETPYLQGGSILAFFVGTILGLVYLQFIPERFSKLIAKSFSISCGIASLILLYIYQNFSYNSKLSGTAALIFFVFLSIRFGFWFYSRVLRASKAASYQHSIAWVEFGYYLGMMLGLVIWKLMGLNFGLSTALVIDALFQFIAGCLDIKNFQLDDISANHPKEQIQAISQSLTIESSLTWCWKLAASVVFLTLAIQVIIFNSAHYVADTLGSYILAIFYFGVALAAFMCNKYKTFISWEYNKNRATIFFKQRESTLSFSLLFLLLFAAFAVVMVISQIFMNRVIINNMLINDLFVCVFVFIAAFIYEVISISILDRIGQEESLLKSSGMIMRTYGFMGLGAAIGFWTLNLAENHLSSNLITLFACMLIISMSVVKRPAILSRMALN